MPGVKAKVSTQFQTVVRGINFFFKYTIPGTIVSAVWMQHMTFSGSIDLLVDCVVSSRTELNPH